MTQRLGLAGTIDYCTYVWPVHMAWASHSLVTRFWEGAFWKRLFQEKQIGARGYLWLSPEVTQCHFCCTQLVKSITIHPDSTTSWEECQRILGLYFMCFPSHTAWEQFFWICSFQFPYLIKNTGLLWGNWKVILSHIPINICSVILKMGH